MKFKLEITLGNDAMQLGEDIAEVLHEAAYSIEQDDAYQGVIVDRNGNNVGEWGFAE